MTKVFVILATFSCLIALHLVAVSGEGPAHGLKPGHGNRRGRHTLLALEHDAHGDERELAQLRNAHWRSIASHGRAMKSKRALEHDAPSGLENNKQTNAHRKPGRLDALRMENVAHAKLSKKQQQQKHKKSGRKGKMAGKEHHQQQRKLKQQQIQQKHQRKLHRANGKHQPQQYNQLNKQQQQHHQHGQQQQQLQRHKRQRHHF